MSKWTQFVIPAIAVLGYVEIGQANLSSAKGKWNVYSTGINVIHNFCDMFDSF